MDSELELNKIRDEVFRKIGRNILNFQKIEIMLKCLIENNEMSGYMSEIMENKVQRAASIGKQTMGQLVGQFIRNTYQETEGTEETDDSLDELKEPYFSSSFRFSTNSDFIKNKTQALKSLVNDRNDLIHHFLPKYSLDSIESCLEIEQYLDQQREKLIPEHDHLYDLIKSLDNIRKAHVEFLESDEGKKMIEELFRKPSAFVELLIKISTEHCRADGWTLLSIAGQHIRQVLPEEIEQFKNESGFKSLKQLLKDSEYFDIDEEATEKGGVRVLYRPKSKTRTWVYGD